MNMAKKSKETPVRAISVVVDAGGSMRGGSSRQSLPVSKLADEVQTFVQDMGEVINKAARSAAAATIASLAEVEVSASVQVGGKLSLLGSGVETKGQAGIKFKFIIPKTGS
jgi:hypothetical protein